MKSVSFNSRLACALAMATFALAACDWTTPKSQGGEELTAKKRQDYARQMKRACASSDTYNRLKVLTFEQALAARPEATGFLDQLAAVTTIRIEEPVAKSRDDRLDVTVCQGHLVLNLPPPAGDRPGAVNRMESDVEYSAQQAADGSGLVYEMRGADAVIAALAALASGKTPATAASTSAIASAQPRTVGPAEDVGDTALVMSKREERVASRLTERIDPRVKPAARLEPTNPPLLQRASAETQVSHNDAEPRVAAARPSFRCDGVSSRVLRMVCSDPALAAADRHMSSNFYAALARGDARTRARLRSTRDRFIGFRNRCASPACVAQAYRDRDAEIRDIERPR